MGSRLPFRLRSGLCLSILLFAISGCYGYSQKSHLTSKPRNSARYLPESRLVLPDLDGDHEPDLVKGSRLGRTKHGDLYQVQLQLTTDRARVPLPFCITVHWV